jgi:curved DNA-binding protein
MSDYYSTLGVNKSASADEIKKAYRKLAMQHHPDRGGDQNKFKEIQNAYDTLSDPEKKSQYDNPNPFGNMGGGWQSDVPPGFEDFFSNFQFGGNPFGFQFRQQTQKNRNLNLQTTITLEDALSGKEIIASITLPNGKEQTIEVKIPKGIQNGTTLRLAGMGDNSFPNLPRGDLHLTVNIAPHNVFQRQGDDLLMNIEIDAIKAVLGTTHTIYSLNGKKLDLKIGAGTQHGKVFSAAGYGMPNMHDPRFIGNLLITVNIKIPTNLSKKQIEILKSFYENT